MRDTAPRRLDALLSPAALGALALLLANDFILKPAFHNALTGKLSDFAGLFLFALFWSALVPRRRTVVAWATAAAFVAWKSPLSQPLLDGWNALGVFPLARVVDWTDLVALLVLPLAHAYRPRPTAWLPVRRVLRPAAALLCVFAFAATSVAPNYLPVADAKYEIELSREDALQRIYDLRLSDGWSAPPAASVEGPDTVTITLPPENTVVVDRLPPLGTTVEVVSRGRASTLRLLSVSSFARLDTDGAGAARRRFERQVVGPLRRGEMGPPPAPDFTSGRYEVLRPRIRAPTSLTEPRGHVQISLARPAYVALVEVSPMRKWRAIYPVTAEQEQLLLGAGEHTLLTACAAPGAASGRTAAGKEVPPCGVAEPLTVVDMRERNPLLPTTGCDPRWMHGEQRPNTPGTLVLLAADRPITRTVAQTLDGRCGNAYVFFNDERILRILWRQVRPRTWALSAMELRR